MVVSNENVASFIKELVLEPEGTAIFPKYHPGDYIQINIPAYEKRSLNDVEVGPAYRDSWKKMGAFDLQAENPIACRRNYSMATNPEVDKQLRFNIRLAVPPRGLDCNAGIGSSYLFSLKPGDVVSGIGPFGEFHPREQAREMVYLGGGAGMAPLRSHLAWLFETRKTPALVSYWYGARSLKELFYQDYFDELSKKNENFSFHVALSEPVPEDEWHSHTGFIHDVLRHEYLASHPNPKSIEYFLCGPPAMIQAATQMLKEMGVNPSQIAFDEF